MSVPIKHSGLQKEVLSLYRSFLRAARKKSPDTRANFKSYIQQEFRRSAKSVTNKDTYAIEYLVRQGKKRLEALRDPSMTNIQL